MDNNYLYIVGFLGLMLVVFVIFYFLQKQKKKDIIKHAEIQQHIEENGNVECDGDKCFIKHGQKKYDNCDYEKCF